MRYAMHFLPCIFLATKAIQQEDHLTLRQQESLVATKGYNHFYTLSLPQLRQLAEHISLGHEKGKYPEGVYQLLMAFLHQRMHDLDNTMQG